MATNNQVTPIGLGLNRFARARAKDQDWLTGRSFPCVVTAVNGALVTVAFQVTAAPGQRAVTIPPATMPIAESEYTRLPIQIGCKGVAMSADAYLGGVSGQGGGTATLGQTGNLTGLVFVPLANVAWSAVDPNTLVLYGEPGVKVQTKDGSVNVEVTQDGAIVNAGTVTINSGVVIINALPGSASTVGQLFQHSGTVMVVT